MLNLVYRDVKTNRLLELKGQALLLDGGLSLKAWWGEWREFASRPDVAAPRWLMSTLVDPPAIDPVNVFLDESEPLIVHARRPLDGSWQEWEAEIDVQLAWSALGRLALTREGGAETLVHQPADDLWFSPTTFLDYEQVLLGSRQTVDDLVRGLAPLPPLPPLGPRLRLSPLAARAGV